VAASALAIDKIRTKQVLESFGLPHAPYEVLYRDQSPLGEQLAGLQSRLGDNLVVKSPTKGSSLGVFLTETEEETEAAARKILEDEDRVLIEVRLEGREVTCGVVDTLTRGRPEALQPTEILPPEGRSFDYEAKYTPGLTREVTPPEDMPAAWIQEIQTRAIQIHRILGLSGLSRADMIVSPEGHATLLEVNTLPGMTETSLLPQAAACAGLDFPGLLNRLIEVTLGQEAPSS
jgi:D-alanine-D-alanine ligase